MTHHADAAKVVLQVIVVDGHGVIGEGDVALLGEQHRQGVAAVNGAAAVVGGDDVGAGYGVDYFSPGQTSREAAALRLSPLSQRERPNGTYDPLPADRRAEFVARSVVGVVDMGSHAVAFDGDVRRQR